MNLETHNTVEAKIDHYQLFLKRRSLIREHSPRLQYIKLSVKEPQYIYRHRDEAYLKLGVPDNPKYHANVESTLATFNNSIISDSFYIFMTFILVLIVSAVFSFAIREYLLYKKSRKDIATASELRFGHQSIKVAQEPQKSAPTPDKGDLLSLEKVIQRQETLAPAPNMKDESGLTKFADDDTQTAENRGWELQQKYDLTSAAISMDVTGSSQRNKDHASGFSDKSISKYANNILPMISSFKDNKIRYSIAELLSLDVGKLSLAVIDKHPEGVQKIPISQLVACPIVIPNTRFEHAWEVSKALMEILKTLNESDLKVEKILAVLKLISIGKQNDFYENPNLFLGYFNTCIEDLIHTCILFDLWADCSATLIVQTLECMLTYCWSHARYQVQNPRVLRMQQQFIKWSGRQPPIQPQMSILHIMFNLYLGLKTAYNLPEDVAKENEMKLSLVIRELIKKSVCNDYIQILPMIARASEASSQNRTKLFFYEMTKLLVSNHKNCCVNVYLKDSNFELKALLKKGLLYPELDPVHKRSKEILGLILECGKEAEIWQVEVLSSATHMPSSLPLSSEYTERLFMQKRKS